MSLILLRHSRPAVADGVCYGRTELDLAPDFERELPRILDELPEVSDVVSSPLRRCLRLAREIALARGLPLRLDERIAEFDFGRWEGLPWASISRVELDAWAADFDGARPHGGENVTMLRDRVAAALSEAPGGEPPALWVTHSGVARAACALRGLGAGWNTELGFGRWLRLEDAEPSQRVGTGVSPR